MPTAVHPSFLTIFFLSLSFSPPTLPFTPSYPTTPLPILIFTLQTLPHLHRQTSGLRKGKGQELQRPVKKVHTHTHTHINTHTTHTRRALLPLRLYTPNHLPKHQAKIATSIAPPPLPPPTPPNLRVRTSCGPARPLSEIDLEGSLGHSSGSALERRALWGHETLMERGHVKQRIRTLHCHIYLFSGIPPLSPPPSPPSSGQISGPSTPSSSITVSRRWMTVERSGTLIDSWSKMECCSRLLRNAVLPMASTCKRSTNRGSCRYFHISPSSCPRLAVQPLQVVVARRNPVRGGRQIVLELVCCAASHEKHSPRERVGGPDLGQHADAGEMALARGRVEAVGSMDKAIPW